MERGVPYRGIGFRVEHGIPGRGIVLRTEDRRKEMGWIIQGALYGRTCNIDPAFSIVAGGLDHADESFWECKR